MPNVKVIRTEPEGSLAKGLLADFDALADRIRRRAYALFEQRGGEHGADRDDWLQAEAELLFPVKTEMNNVPGHQTFRLSVPGFTAQDLRVYTMEDTLVVKGAATQTADDQGVTSEDNLSFLYQWPLPTGAHTDEITAEYKQERLTIDIPMEAESKLVEIQTPESKSTESAASAAAAA